jgi:hypothetical protein
MNRGTLEQERTAEILQLFTPVEGMNAVYYGKVRNGKTRSATADILELLKRGEPVVANWLINFEDYDERDDFGVLLVKFLFGRKHFFKYKKENFHYIAPHDLITGKGEFNIEYLSLLVGVHIFIDEGQWLFNSMERLNMEDPASVAKHKLILHGGHYCRSLNIITQRPENVFKTMRSQINVWYRCVKRFDIFGFMLFQRWAIEDMKDDLPVELTDDDKPNGEVKNYFVNKKHDPVFKAYNTHGMREDNAVEVTTEVEVYNTTFFDRLSMLVSALVPRRAMIARSDTTRLTERLKVDTDDTVRKIPIHRG